MNAPTMPTSMPNMPAAQGNNPFGYFPTGQAGGAWGNQWGNNTQTNGWGVPQSWSPFGWGQNNSPGQLPQWNPGNWPGWPGANPNQQTNQWQLQSQFGPGTFTPVNIDIDGNGTVDQGHQWTKPDGTTSHVMSKGYNMSLGPNMPADQKEIYDALMAANGVFPHTTTLGGKTAIIHGHQVNPQYGGGATALIEYPTAAPNTQTEEEPQNTTVQPTTAPGASRTERFGLGVYVTQNIDINGDGAPTPAHLRTTWEDGKVKVSICASLKAAGAQGPNHDPTLVAIAAALGKSVEQLQPGDTAEVFGRNITVKSITPPDPNLVGGTTEYNVEMT